MVRGRVRAAGVVRRGRRAGRVGDGRGAPRDARVARGRPVPAVPRALHLERARHDGEEAAGFVTLHSCDAFSKKIALFLNIRKRHINFSFCLLKQAVIAHM